MLQGSALNHSTGPYACAALVWLAVAIGQSPGQESGLPMFELVSPTGVAAAGFLANIQSGWSATLAGAPTLPGNKVVALRRLKLALPPWPQRGHVVLLNGDLVAGRPVQTKDERLELEGSLASNAGASPVQLLRIRLDSVAAIWWDAPEGIEDAELFERSLLDRPRRQDILWLRNGDRLEGDFIGIALDQLRMQLRGGGQASIPADKLAVLALSTEQSRPQVYNGLYGRIVLADGSRLSLTSALADERTITGKMFQGETVRINVKQIISINVFGGCAVYLSELEPARYEHSSFLGLRWPFTRNTSVSGHEMRLGGNAYDEGIGLHSESRLDFDLKGGFDWFEALVGLDERSGRRGSVEIEVSVDGKKQNIGKAELTVRDKARPIRVRVTGGRMLTLAVKFGQGGDIQDHVDWAQARLLKELGG